MENTTILLALLIPLILPCTQSQDAHEKGNDSRIFHPGWWLGLSCLFPQASQEQLDCRSCCTQKQCPHNNVCRSGGVCSSVIPAAAPGTAEICFTSESTNTCTNLEKCKEAGGTDVCGVKTSYCVPSRTCP